MCRLDGVFTALSSSRNGFFSKQIGFLREFCLPRLLASQRWSERPERNAREHSENSCFPQSSYAALVREFGADAAKADY